MNDVEKVKITESKTASKKYNEINAKEISHTRPVSMSIGGPLNYPKTSPRGNKARKLVSQVSSHHYIP